MTEGDITAARIGARVGELREAHGSTVTDLALRVGVAPAVVHAIEGGLRLPTIGLLYRVAAGLDVAPGELLPSPLDRPRVDVHLPVLDGPDSTTAQVIGGGPGNPTQTYLFDLRAGEGDGGFGSHRGEELLVVVEGEVVASALGRPDELVRAGGSKVIDTGVPHAARASDAGPARFLLVCTDACDH
ncbi:XRE family transcriptional regulator [Amnibacterium kyonggiense]|uniref:XRE family transcriptional regulator n=1 Tax=Amnibacterium kyonggiense TaxID=595671 RepID=A0A4V6Q0Z3_9MICO|nr:XRE family transcriptional regulator [Amnibacterium kyonggiense]